MLDDALVTSQGECGSSPVDVGRAVHLFVACEEARIALAYQASAYLSLGGGETVDGGADLPPLDGVLEVLCSTTLPLDRLQEVYSGPRKLDTVFS